MRICSVENCVEKHRTNGYCRNHERKWKLYGDPLVPNKKVGPKKNFCKVPDCSGEARAYCYCSKHWSRMQRLGTVEWSPATEEERFHSGYTKGNSCWEWIKGKDKNGYGKFSTRENKKHVRAHRYSWELFNNQKIPDGKCVCHSCDNPPCVNPDHLWIGTHKENTHDKMKKGRGKTNPYRDSRNGRFISSNSSH